MMGFFPFIISSVILIIVSKVLARGIGSVGIVGGDDAPSNSYTYTVSLQHDGEHICGGGIIGDKFILTAAHCVINENGKFSSKVLTVIIGAVNLWKLPSSAMSILTETIYVPVIFQRQLQESDPTYRSEGDIAVLKLSESMKLEKNQHLVKLKFSWSIFNMLRKEAVITGYGDNVVEVVTDPRTNETYELGQSFGRMRFAKTKIISNRVCQPSFMRKLHNSYICAKVYQRHENSSEGACSGDSGGPLVRRGNVVIGILSTSPCANSEGFPMGAYTRVNSFKRFIKDAMKGNPGPDIRVANLYNYDQSCDRMGSYIKEDGVSIASDVTDETADSSYGGIHF